MFDAPARVVEWMEKLLHEHVTVIVDTREQRPFEITKMQNERMKLDSGDYSIKGLEKLVAVERKELNDLASCFTVGRDRFKAELERLREIPKRIVVVEASWGQLAEGDFTSRVHPNSAMGSIASWSGFFEIGFFFAGSRARAQGFTNNYLWQIAKAHYEEAKRKRGNRTE